MAQGAKPRDGSSLPRVRAVSRAIAILRAFTPEAPYLPLAGVAARAGLDAGTTRRILVTLRDDGLVRQDERSGHYCLTLGVLQLAGAVPQADSLKDLTENVLIALADETRATVFLSAAIDEEAICLARYHGESAIQVRWWAVGGSLPLNCGAAPKILFAYMPEEMRERLLDQEMTQLTPHSVADPKALRGELDTIRERGWALAQDDVAEGLSALAAPVRNDAGEVIAAVSIGGLTPQILGGSEPKLLPRLLACADDLSGRLRHYSKNELR